MHVNVIGILAGSLSPREPARRLTVQGKVIKHLNVEANWDVATASEDITPQFVKVKPHFLWLQAKEQSYIQ
jgi:hypothetical protein